jgi:hypothetical protein
MDTRGIPPTQALVHEIATLLLTERVRTLSEANLKLGVNWVYRFI